MTSPDELEKLLINRVPTDYAAAAVVAREIGIELLARLDFMTLQPEVIVDVGCDVGERVMQLAKRYPQAKVIAIDSSQAMLDYAKQQILENKNIDWQCQSPDHLLLPDHSVDLITANLVLPWHANLAELFREWRRVLRPHGLLMLTSLGPDTLRELAIAAQPNFIDMHLIGDALIQAGFADPVLETEMITLTYREPDRLWAELQATSMVSPEVAPCLIEKNDAGLYPLTYEVIYAHAFRPELMTDHKSDASGEVRIPISHIKRRFK